ncbi:MAG: hypothetical protein RL518_746 [Pseudomonadota bacterium]|jgi:hypothetical protein
MPTDSLEKLKRLLIPVAIGLTMASCGGVGGGGGGGGGEGANYPGYTELYVERDSIDSGDLTDITATVADINRNGVFLKFHYPSSLAYRSGSAIMHSGDAESWATTAPFSAATNGTDKYLVFRVSRPPEDEDNRVTIGFTLRAVSGDPSAYVEVELDNNDPALPDSKEFNESYPQFSGDDRWNISIAGTPAATPTPAAIGSATPAATATPSN